MRGLCLLVVAVLVNDVLSTSAPFQCLYIKDSFFTCDYSAMVLNTDRPINFIQFNPTPQILEVQVNGFVPFYGDAQVFDPAFAGINKAGFDNNAAAALTLDCGRGGSMYMTTGAFANMSHVQNLKILNCNVLNIPSRVFEDFAALDYFGFEGGTIDIVDPNAMTGLNVEKLTTDTHSIPRNLGHFEILYSKFVSQSVPAGLLYSWKNLTSVTLRGCDINSLSSDIFRYNTKLRYIDLSDNGFTSIPSDIFSGLSSLADFHVNDILWDCSCANTWFVPYAVDNNITVHGDAMCTSGVTIYKYYDDNCVTVDYCENLTGFTMSKQCVTAISFTVLLLSLGALPMTIVALVYIVILRKTLVANEARRVQAMGRWNKVIDSTMAWRNKK